LGWSRTLTAAAITLGALYWVHSGKLLKIICRTPISRACWSEDHRSLMPQEDQGQTVPTSERTELKVQ
jgi:hypothetical protein